MADIASEWMSAGTKTVMLPSGVRVRWEPTTVPDLMVRGILPGYLRSIALQFYGEGVTPSKLDPAKDAEWKALVALLIIESVREVAMPDGELAPYRLSDAQVNDADPRMPRVDLEALQHLCLHLRSPLEVNATSSVAQLQHRMRDAIERDATDDELTLLKQEIESRAAEFRHVIEKEAANSVAGWATFPDIGRSLVAGNPVQDVEPAAVEPADHLGPGGRPRRRRRARAAAGTGADQSPAV